MKASGKVGIKDSTTGVFQMNTFQGCSETNIDSCVKKEENVEYQIDFTTPIGENSIYNIF